VSDHRNNLLTSRENTRHDGRGFAVADVCRRFEDAVTKAFAAKENDFDGTARIINYIPGAGQEIRCLVPEAAGLFRSASAFPDQCQSFPWFHVHHIHGVAWHSAYFTSSV
jgi:hypothetical protein